jgi:ribosome-associated toxin RatA of RatAB toxin-antitoxin module
MLEPNTFVDSHNEDLQADIDGSRLALEVEFTKTYQAGTGAHHIPIIYSGTVDKAFTLLRGTWAFPDGPMFDKGIFEMSRASVGIESARLRSLLATVDQR